MTLLSSLASFHDQLTSFHDLIQALSQTQSTNSNPFTVTKSFTTNLSLRVKTSFSDPLPHSNPCSLNSHPFPGETLRKGETPGSGSVKEAANGAGLGRPAAGGGGAGFGKKFGCIPNGSIAYKAQPMDLFAATPMTVQDLNEGDDKGDPNIGNDRNHLIIKSEEGSTIKAEKVPKKKKLKAKMVRKLDDIIDKEKVPGTPDLWITVPASRLNLLDKLKKSTSSKWADR